MAISVDPNNTTAVGLPDDGNTTTSVTVQSSTQPYKPTRYINTFCDAVDHEAAAIGTDLNRMDSGDRGFVARTNSGLFGGTSIFAMKLVSGTLHLVSALVPKIFHPIDSSSKIIEHPEDTVEGAKQALGKAIVETGNKAVRGKELVLAGRYAEGVSKLSEFTGDFVTYLMGARGFVEAAARFARKGAELTFSEIAATANAINEGSGGAMATASGVYMSADAAVAAPVATMSMPSSGLLGGPLMMSMADDAAGGATGAGQIRIYRVKNAHGATCKIDVRLLDNGKASLTYKGRKAVETVIIDAPGTTIDARFSVVDKYVNTMAEGPDISVSVFEIDVRLLDNGEASLTYKGREAVETVIIDAPGATIDARFSVVDKYVNTMGEESGISVSDVGLDKLNDKLDNLLFQKERVPHQYDSTVTEIREMAAGGTADGIRKAYYPGWTDNDFKMLLEALGEKV